MPIEPAAVSVKAPVEDLADWLEIRAFRDRDGNGSYIDLLNALRMSGTVDALSEDDDEAEPEARTWEDPYEGAAESALSEIADRFKACGAEDGSYPFETGANFVALTSNTHSSVYVFLLLLSCYGQHPSVRGAAGEKLFEEVCAKAAEAYLGGRHANVKSLVFGFPRRVLPRGFRDAVTALCGALQEGRGPKARPNLRDQKDAKLDVVAWRGFDDGRAGKLIAFGQCATGSNWTEKLTELQADKWCFLWMEEMPAVNPIRVFFVPHRVSEREWISANAYGGILFDRCRIARHSQLLGRPLQRQLEAWSQHVLTKIGGWRINE
jgi:hypothetical protein